MNIGMLWFDNDPKAEITVKVERAATYYREKYGKAPNMCFVHPKMLGVESAEQPTKQIFNGGIEVHTSPFVLPNHFWIGVNGKISLTES